MAAKYAGRVYLLGSVLHTPNPRDIDIRIVVADHEFAARYGHEIRPLPKPIERGAVTTVNGVCWDEDGPTQRWIDDVAKIGAAMSVRINHNVDLKVWPASYWHDRTYPAPLLLAGPSQSQWFYNEFVPEPKE